MKLKNTFADYLRNATSRHTTKTILLTAIALMSINSLSFAQNVPSYVPTNGLAGWWPFNGNANDESGNGYNGTVNGATLTTDRFGLTSKCYEFNGSTQPGSNNTVIITDNVIDIPGFNAAFTNEITISVWANVYTSNNGEFLQRRTNNNIDFSVGCSAGVPGLHFGNVGNFNSSTSISYNSWHHYVYLYDGSLMKIYLDGNLISQQAGTGQMNNNTTIMNLGKYIYYGGFTHYFFYNGKLDDIGIWNRALSSTEVQQLYQSQSPCSLTTNFFPQDTIGACGSSVSLDALNTGSTYNWNTGATTQSITVSNSNWYRCTVAQGNCSTSDSVFISLINADISNSDTTICAGSNLVLSATQSSQTNSSAIYNSGAPNPWNYPSPADGGYIPLGTFGTPSVFSISCYINPSDVQAGIAIIMDCNHGGNLNWVIQNYPNISSGSNWSFGTLQFTLVPNTWQHLLITYNNGQKKAYVNGVLQATAFENINWSGNPGLFLGNWPEGARRFHGGIDELYITYDLQQTNNFSPLPRITSPSPNTFGLWHFDEAQGISTSKSDGTSYSLNNWNWVTRPSTNSSVSYLWSTGETSASIIVSPNQTTTYKLFVTDGVITCTDSAVVTVNNVLNNLFAQDTIRACGTSYTLDAGPGYSSYAWSTGAISQSISVTSSGFYRCSVFQGGCSTSDSIFVSLVDANIFNNDTSICFGQSITLSTGVAGAASSGGVLLQPSLQQGLVAWWPFDSNANDLSGNGFNGTLQNGVQSTTDRFGVANSAYLFDGIDDHISLPGQLNNGQTLPEFTISCWFNKNSASDGIIWAKSGFWKEVVLYTNSQNQVGFFYAYPSPQAYYGLLVNTPFTLNTWNHVVFMQKNSIFYAYLNGQLVQTGPSNSLINWAQDNGGCSTGENFIGMGRYCQSFYYQPLCGKIDDIAIWNRALTTTESQGLYSLNNLSTSWSTGATTPSITVSPTQTTTYYCTISNGISSCTDSIKINVVNPTTGIQTISSTCGLPNATLNGSASGGSGSYNYLWSNGATTASVSNLSAGTYTLTVTDNNGCTASSSANVNNSICPKLNTQSTVNNITQNSASISWPAVSCANKYRVVVKNISTGTQTTSLVSAPNTTLNLSGLQANTTYQVRIRTQCSQNGTVVSQLSPIKSFTTLNNQGIQCLPPTVSGINLSNTSVTINWTPATGAIQYNLRYRPVGTSTWTAIIIGSGLSNSTTLQNLVPATAYEFQIRTKCNDNPEEFSPYSSILTFTTLPQRLAEGDHQLNILLYPNPTNNNINVVINAVGETQTTIRITDLLGRVLLNETEELIGGNNTITYNISDYAAGVYLIHVGNGNTQQVFKVVKE